MITRVFDGIKFCEQFLGPPKKHSCQVWFKLAQRFRRSWEIVDDALRTILKAPLKHVVLRWANKGLFGIGLKRKRLFWVQGFSSYETV